MPSTSLYQMHIHTMYTLSQCTCQVHIHTKYIFMPSTSLCHVYCTYSYQEHFRTKYTFKPSTYPSQVHIYGTGGWHLTAGREGAYTPHGCSQCSEMAESATLLVMSDKGTPPPCKIDSSKPCPIPALQPLFVPTGWLHFFPDTVSIYVSSMDRWL